MSAPLPFSAAADRNKEAIANALAEYFENATTVLEIGSGSGQHAVYFCQQFKHLQWQVTEQSHYLEGLRAYIAHASVANIQQPFEIEVGTYKGDTRYTFAYSANTAHIMSIDKVQAMFKVVNASLMTDGIFALYGPFRENGLHNSDGNSQFDVSLRAQDPKMGIRDIAELESIAASSGLALLKQISMPSNNRILLWCGLSGR